MKPHILICDDDVHILRALEYKLRSSGYEVTVAYNGAEAAELAPLLKPSLIVTDCQMPLMSGLDLASVLQSTADTRNIPIIMLTAKGLELSSDHLRDKYGIRRLINKPFSPREVQKQIQELLDGCNSPAPQPANLALPAPYPVGG